MQSRLDSNDSYSTGLERDDRKIARPPKSACEGRPPRQTGMGSSLSLAHVGRTRDAILLALHTHFRGTHEPLSQRTLAVFRRVDRANRGWLASSSLDEVLHDLGIAGRYDRLEIDAFAHCFTVEDDTEAYGARTSSRLDYVAFLDFVFYPIQASPERASLKITQQAVVSAGGWLVYEGEFVGQPVVVKQVEAQDKSGDDEMTVQLRSRVSMLRLLSHPHIRRYVTTIQTNQSLYLVQQRHPSCTLKTILESFGPMKEATIRRYLVQVLEALSYLHSHEIVHGNLHLESIHIDSSGLLQLSDFGASRAFQRLTSFSSPSDWLTQYSPPEQARSKVEGLGVTKAADVWGVGVLILQMACGVGQHEDSSKQTPRNTKTTTSPPGGNRADHPALPTSMSKDLRDVVRACLQPRAKVRPSIDAILSQFAFFQVDPTQTTREILREVCSDLDESMQRLTSSTTRVSSSTPRASARTTSSRSSAPNMRPLNLGR